MRASVCASECVGTCVRAPCNGIVGCRLGFHEGQRAQQVHKGRLTDDLDACVVIIDGMLD